MINSSCAAGGGADCEQLAFEGLLTTLPATRTRKSVLSPLKQHCHLNQEQLKIFREAVILEIGPEASPSEVDLALAARVSDLTAPFSTREVHACAVALSCCGHVAVLPLTQRAFYCFVGPKMSPTSAALKLWQTFQASYSQHRFVHIFLRTSMVSHPWWSHACHDLIVRSGAAPTIPFGWDSFGLTSTKIDDLVSLFPDTQRPVSQRSARRPTQSLIE